VPVNVYQLTAWANRLNGDEAKTETEQRWEVKKNKTDKRLDHEYHRTLNEF